MAIGRSPRADVRRSPSSFSSTAVIVVFVALCLVGVWMMTSSSVVPVQNIEISQDGKVDVKDTTTEPDTRQFEDNPGVLPEDATKGDSNQSSPQDNQKSSQQSNGDASQENQVQKSEESGDKVTGTEDTSNPEKSTGSDDTSNPEKSTDTVAGSDDASNLEKSTDKATGSDDTSNPDTETNSGESKTEDGGSNSESGETKTEDGETNASEKSESGENPGETKEEDKMGGQTEENQDKESESSSDKKEDEDKSQVQNEVLPDAAQAEIQNETTTQNGAFSTQRSESKNEKEVQQSSVAKDESASEYQWKVCNVTAGPDYIPCLDNIYAVKRLRSTKHYEHRERHCPEEPPTCLVPLPEGYKKSIKWPKSRNKIWYSNVPHTKLAEIKGHQNWVKVSGEYLTFPGGGTQFKQGALHYVEFIQEELADIAWGKQSRVVLDVGCGVASFGGFLFDKDVLAMSFAPKDEHEAQVQFALERGIPAISAVMGTTRLPFPGRVFDVVHCARCRVPWHIEGGKLLLELNRVLRPGGYFVWSATPVYRKEAEDVGIWKAMSELTKKMCWDLLIVKKDTVNRVGVAIYRKPSSNECYGKRPQDDPPLCKESDDPNAAWNITMQSCMHKLPVQASERGSQWPEQWPLRLEKPPYWLKSTELGVYGKAAPEDFTADYEHWKRVVTNSYLHGMGISWSDVRNVMDMRSVYGGFAAALKDLNVWVMNVVTIDSPDTLPIIYERGLFGIYHDWCESFSTYPRSYDLLHADHLFSKLKKRCNLVAVMAEVDRILRPEGKLIVRDNVEIINEIERMAKSLKWEIRLTYSKDAEGLLCVQKTMWRPKEIEVIASATV
ncbi:hypothetical protein MKW94_030810 [Papaver nudicaule]|uniref:Methyltransferase PMT26 n=1 Tax=Papaver nudicaule TaxID=74823 RepID=A0AA41SIW1_PAPNU|nr:hypothetical protein [Papaver nudicaule]